MAGYNDRMTGVGAIRKMIYSSGKTQRAISVELKRSPAFVSTYMSRNTCPSLDLAAEIGKVCGWRLQFVNDNGELIEVKA